jgi:DNA polymerase (family 10)
VAARTEEDVYAALGLAWVPPELREMHGEIAMARDGTLPKLIELKDLRADLHMHTTRTDGRDSIDAMVEGARERGHEYIAITEHSKAIAMAFGFDAARVRQSIGEIEAARKRHPDIHILHGLEVDILADGELDLDDETLALLDWVIVSIHSRFEQPPDVATARALRAVSHPLVHAFGHPTGRAIGSRDPLPFDVERVSEAAAANGVAMEINAAPARLDLSDVNARLARAKGCRFVIDTDAHAVGQLDLLQFGVFQARRAGLTAADVWNTLPFERFREGLLDRRGRGPAPKPMRATAAANGGEAQPSARSEPAARREPAKAAPAAKPVRKTAAAKPAAKGASRAKKRRG